MGNNTFGARLREARKNARMTQKELASAIGAKHNSVSNWENDQNMPDPDTIVRICETLNVGADYMLPSKNARGNSVEDPTEEREDDIWEFRESVRRNPEMRILFDAAKGATAKQLKQAVAILEALKASDGNV